MRKIDSVLLIDDSIPINYLHKMIIDQSGIAQKCMSVNNGQEAMDFIKNNHLPDLIFLDINMPILNGWEFLEAFKKFNSKLVKKIIIIMLTSSINPDDRDKAKGRVEEYLVKPLSNETLTELLQKHFA